VCWWQDPKSPEISLFSDLLNMNIGKFLRHIPLNPKEVPALLTMDKLKKGWKFPFERAVHSFGRVCGIICENQGI
jgi:hypothetical protein